MNLVLLQETNNNNRTSNFLAQEPTRTKFSKVKGSAQKKSYKDKQQTVLYMHTLATTHC